MIRLILCGLWAVLSVVFMMPVHWYHKALSKKHPEKAWKKSQKLVRGFFKGLIFLAGTRIEVRGRENLPDKDQAALFIGNHRSYFDIIILQTLSKGPMGFVAKKEFLKVPLFHCYIEDMGSLFLDRENVRAGLETIKEGTDRMSKGLSLGLFPEGTRNHTDTLLPFKTGGYRMAEKSDSAMVLVAMTGFDRILETNFLHFIRSRHVIIEFAPAVYPGRMEAAERKEFYRSIPDRITAMLESHKSPAAAKDGSGAGSGI